MGRDLEICVCKSGVGRFMKLGMPFPRFTADFVSYLEIGGDCCWQRVECEDDRAARS